MATPEFRWPITTRMSLSAMMFFAFATPTSGLAWSSKGTRSTLKPCFSRAPLNFSMASCAPSLMPSPTAAERALRGDLDGALAALRLEIRGRERRHGQDGDERKNEVAPVTDHRCPP